MSVSIVGGGGGTSNCTDDETNTAFTTRSNDETVTFAYLAKGDGGCALQLSFSQFKVRIKNPAGQLVGSGVLFYGQQYVNGDYVVSCGYGPWAGASSRCCATFEATHAVPLMSRIDAVDWGLLATADERRFQPETGVVSAMCCWSARGSWRSCGPRSTRRLRARGGWS